MSHKVSEFFLAPRKVTIEGLGELVIRRPMYSEVLDAERNKLWWGACVQTLSGLPFFAPGENLGELDYELASALVTEVMKPRPTPPLKSGCGEEQVQK